VRKRIEGRLREIIIALYFATEAERLRNERFPREAVRRAEEEQRRWEREERERQERGRAGATCGGQGLGRCASHS
jgi:hypothetical protein